MLHSSSSFCVGNSCVAIPSHHLHQATLMTQRQLQQQQQQLQLQLQNHFPFRIALTWSGSFRSFATTLPHFIKHLIQPLREAGCQVVIFAHVAVQTSSLVSPTLSLVHACFSEYSLTPLIGNISVEADQDFKKTTEWETWIKQTNGTAVDKGWLRSDRMVLQLWSVRESLRMKRAYEERMGWKFTYVYRLRYDYLIKKLALPFLLPDSSSPSVPIPIPVPLPQLLPADSARNVPLSKNTPTYASLTATPAFVSADQSPMARHTQKNIIRNIHQLTPHHIWMPIPTETIPKDQSHDSSSPSSSSSLSLSASLSASASASGWMFRPSSLYVGGDSWFYGISDQFAMGSSSVMDLYGERFNLKMVQQFLDTWDWKKWHPETYLMWTFTAYKQTNIYQYPACYSVIREAKGSHSQTKCTLSAGYGRSACDSFCRSGDVLCYSSDWESSADFPSISAPLLADIAPHTINITSYEAVLNDCITTHEKNGNGNGNGHRQICNQTRIQQLVQQNNQRRKRLQARCPLLDETNITQYEYAPVPVPVPGPVANNSWLVQLLPTPGIHCWLISLASIAVAHAGYSWAIG